MSSVCITFFDLHIWVPCHLSTDMTPSANEMIRTIIYTNNTVNNTSRRIPPSNTYYRPRSHLSAEKLTKRRLHRRISNFSSVSIVVDPAPPQIPLPHLVWEREAPALGVLFLPGIFFCRQISKNNFVLANIVLLVWDQILLQYLAPTHNNPQSLYVPYISHFISINC